MAWLPDKLDDKQQEFLDANFDKTNYWIKGFPGTGKTVLLAYAINKIKSNHPEANLIVIVFTHAMIALLKTALQEKGISGVNVITYYTFMKSNRMYDYVLSDEVQDLTPRVLKAMKSQAKHIIVAGDVNQSIYLQDPQYEERTVNLDEIENLIEAVPFELIVNHRLSRYIISIVNKFLPDMGILKGKVDPNKTGTQVRICRADNRNDEVEYIMREAKKAVNVGKMAVVLIPTKVDIIDFVNHVLIQNGKAEWLPIRNNNKDYDWKNLNDYLQTYNIPLQYVGNGYGVFSERDKRIIIMTYHSSKGLDFENVFMPFLNRYLRIPDGGNENLGKTLFMVAMTRSRNNLYLTYSGEPHSYLNNFKSDCHYIDIRKEVSVKNITPESKNDNPFKI